MTGIAGVSGGGGGEGGEIAETLKQSQPQPQPQQPPQEPPQQQQQSKTTNSSSENNNNNRYWMRDLYKYSYPRGYGGASGLYNLAWAQAVQNKPLNDVLVELETKDAQEKQSGGDNVNKEESDKEEGELEEGEIDGEDIEEDDNGDNSNNNDIKDTNNTTNNNKKANNNKKVEAMETEDGELEIQVCSIRKVLDNVTVSETHKSFDIVCARLRSSLESLRELVLHTWFPSKDDLIKQSFSALLCVYSVFSSMSSTLRDHNRDKMSRLLTFVMSLSSVLFTPDQRKEVEAMIAVVTPPPPPQPALPKPKARERQEELPVTDNKAILIDSNTMSVNAGDSTTSVRGVGSDSSSHQSDKQNSNSLFGAMKPFQTNLNVRVGSFGPLLDPHKVHDEDSLPSPTSKTPPTTLSLFEPAAPPRVVHGLHNSLMHPYETEALKAISSYQQKFGRSSFLAQDRLPSPTPSEDGNDGGADDLSEEVSSSTTYRNNNIKNANLSFVTQPTPSSAVATNIPTVQTSAVATSIPVSQTLVSGISTGHSSAGVNPVSRVVGKSRDPRLRHLSSKGSADLSSSPSPLLPGLSTKLEPLEYIMNLKKKPEGPSMDSPEPKRQRNGVEATHMSTNVSEVRTVPGITGLDTSSILAPLANRGFVGPPTDPRKSVGTVNTSGITSVNPIPIVSTMSQPVTNVSNADPLQSLLKGFPGNPAAWISMFKEQQKLSDPLQNASHSAPSNVGRMQVALPTSAPTISSGLVQASSGLAQPPSQSPQKDPAKPRMKPQDPRRARQSIPTQKIEKHASDQPTVNGVHNVSNKGVLENSSSQVHVNDSNPSPASSGGLELPDIARQFTKNLKNIADIVTGPVTSSISSQSAPINVESTTAVSGGGPENTGDRRALRPGEVVAGRPQSQNQWGDVEHLFEGYDAQERADIQKQRARRMDEQKKMFDSRKLCLVLDLDHTLLNSAKFAEVDPRHDEILRKKEEHDREQPLSHLFRFPHMGMWTKLRPGIWTFLEKASKLYELHLYTMGNKLYATEMAKVLDPKGSLFSGRVISRGDDGEPVDGDDRAPKSKDLEGVLGLESAVVIIDDSVRVWPLNKLNLIVVERYLYFPCSRRHFGLSGPSLLDYDRDERPEEGTLACCLGVIERIHQNFFANKSLDDVDVRNILASEQRKVLGGCRILFSRVFPVGEANPHLYPLWQTAEQFGAVCTNQIDEQVTHVVANAPGTDKVNWALSTGRFVVHPSWVEASAVLYRRANEQDFAIKP